MRLSGMCVHTDDDNGASCVTATKEGLACVGAGQTGAPTGL